MHPDTPTTPAPGERRDAVARILAAGLLRLREQPARAALADDGSENSVNSSQNCLELSTGMVLSVHKG
jgi:hypothetical protein